MNKGRELIPIRKVIKNLKDEISTLSFIGSYYERLAKIEPLSFQEEVEQINNEIKAKYDSFLKDIKNDLSNENGDYNYIIKLYTKFGKSLQTGYPLGDKWDDNNSDYFNSFDENQLFIAEEILKIQKFELKHFLGELKGLIEKTKKDTFNESSPSIKNIIPQIEGT